MTELLLGDCLNVMKTLPSESVDLIVTSPPYNIGISYNSYKDDLPWNEYLKWTLEWATEVKHLLKPDGSFF